MADQDRSQTPSGDEGTRRPAQQGSGKDKDNEWLIGQMGEDDNLSGSSTYRTLPDQPKDGRDDSDAHDRQSNR